MGPSPEVNIRPREDAAEDTTAYGVLVENVPTVPSEEDTMIAQTSIECTNKTGKDNIFTLKWPNIDNTSPISEYDCNEKIFASAFPWLFPSGLGDYMNLRNKEQKITADDWAKRLILYEDARFAKDKMFCFFVLNYCTRR